MTVDRTELRRLHAAATPGPWKVGYAADGEPYEMVVEFDGIALDIGEGNYPLIVAAVNALPVLLDRLDTYQKALEFYARAPWKDTPDGSSHGCGDYSEKERELGYGTISDPRFDYAQPARAALDTEQT